MTIGTKIIGIVNATPDSFSSEYQGEYLPELAIKALYNQLEAGADIIDIGAESTRPGAMALHAEEEWARLAPVLAAVQADMLAAHLHISVDTYHPLTAKRALDMGVQVINDVSGLQNPSMCEVLAQYDCGIISMHAVSLPANKNKTLPADTNIKKWLNHWLNGQKETLGKYNIKEERVTFDPGIGFGKTAPQSLRLMAEILARNHLQERWVIGHSRKSCLNLIEEHPAPKRDGLTRAFSAQFMLAGIYAVRVHDVIGHAALRVALAG